MGLSQNRASEIPWFGHPFPKQKKGMREYTRFSATKPREATKLGPVVAHPGTHSNPDPYWSHFLLLLYGI